jgi:cell division transport system permease protein
VRAAQLPYFISRAVQNLRHFFLLNLITVSIISVSLLVLSVFLLIYLNLQTYLDSLRSQILVTAYLADTVTPEEVTVLKEKIARFPEAKTVSHTSKEEALAFFKRTFPAQEQVLTGLEENPLPASIDVELKEGYSTPDQVGDFAARIKRVPGVEAVEYGQSWLEGITGFIRFVRSVALTVGMLMVLATVFIIANTIKLTVYARKDEIETMRLVGATNFFIKAPFFIEGIIQGLLAAVLALGTLYGCYRLFCGWLAQSTHLQLQSITISYLPLGYLLLIIAGGVVTGFLGSCFSVGRYLRL